MEAVHSPETLVTVYYGGSSQKAVKFLAVYIATARCVVKTHAGGFLTER